MAGAGTGGSATAGAGGSSGTAGAAGTAGAGGSSGTAGTGSGGSASYTPSTPGCPLWKGNCVSGETSCSTSLASSTNCGACGVSCQAGEKCVGSLCAEDVNPSLLASTKFFPGKTGLIMTYMEGTERGVAKVPVISGTVTKVAVFNNTPFAFLCNSPDAAADGDDGAIYMSCANNQIWKVPAAGGTVSKLLDAGSPNSNNLENVAVIGSKLFYVGDGGIFRANLDGSGAELWMKNSCVSYLAADTAAGEIVFFCKYDHAIRVRAASAPPSLDYTYDREIVTTGNNSLWIDATHYWYRRIGKLVGNFYQSSLLRVPKQGGAEQTMLDLFTPPAVAVHVGSGGAYVAQLIDKTDYHMRLIRVAKDGVPEQVLVDWMYGYQADWSSLYVGDTSLLLRKLGGFFRLPL
jgi:hypothetical protein